MTLCKTVTCHYIARTGEDFCPTCLGKQEHEQAKNAAPRSMAERYPQYFKSVKGMAEVDVYAVHHLFDINDPSGAIQHASKKLLLSGVRTGGKSQLDDIREARDSLTRWLHLQEQLG